MAIAVLDLIPIHGLGMSKCFGLSAKWTSLSHGLLLDPSIAMAKDCPVPTFPQGPRVCPSNISDSGKSRRNWVIGLDLWGHPLLPSRVHPQYRLLHWREEGTDAGQVMTMSTSLLNTSVLGWFFFPLLLWLNCISLLQHIPSLYVEALTPSSQTMALLGDGVFTGVIEVK